jgi:hypothetical protein
VTVELAVQWIGILFAAVLAVGAAFKIVRDVILYRKPSVDAPAGPVDDQAEDGTIFRKIAEQLNVWSSNQKSQSDRMIAVLDSMALSFDKFARGQDRWMKQMFGGDGGGYSEMTDAEGELRERAEGIRRRYGVTWEEAMDRAKKTFVYDPDAKMRDNV